MLFELILPPGKEAVVIYKFIASDNPSTTYGYKSKYLLIMARKNF